jgi:restriction endonuclease S subunit
LKPIPVSIPPLPVQRRIAAILDQADALRAKRQEALAQLDSLMHSIFFDMFGDPVGNPKGWEVKKLKEISTAILSGSTPNGGSQVYVADGIAFFRSQNVWKNSLSLDDVAYIDVETHSKMKKSSLQNKDILITKTGRINTENSSLGRAAIFTGKNDTANINGHVYLVRLKTGLIHKFVLHILITDEYREFIRSVCVGGIDKRQINKEHLEDFPIIFPPLDLQCRFADIVENIEKQKSLAIAQLAALENMFASLQHRAFRGEL